MSRPGEDISAFRAFADYEPPSAPVAHIAQRTLLRVRRILSRNEDRVVEDDGLKRASRATLDDFTASPDCSLLSRELDATLGDWAGGGDEEVSGGTLRLIVIPPGDTNALLATWAERHGHATLASPDPDALLAGTGVDLPEIDGPGVLVVPRLEHWFVRHRHGLDTVRDLLARLSRRERRCVVGCNSWAWSYLRRAVEADLLLPEPLTFAPFDAERLRHWLEELAEEEGTRNAVFRESGSGTDVFARDEGGGFASDFLPSLAARSLGIPWVAWQLWQRSLRTRRVDKDGEREEEAPGAGVADDVPRDENTLWLVPGDGFSLPIGHERTAALVLHALLLHGRLGADELALVLPLVGESSILPALERAGFVERTDGRYRCAAAAYPAIVEHLVTAGLTAPVF